MKNKPKRVNKYFIYDIIGMVVYGLVLYFGFAWLAGFSLIYGYIWSFALIVIATALDEYANKVMQSDDTIRLIKEKYGVEKMHRIMSGGFITFKTLLYLFYIFILVASQIISIDPALINVKFADFILANNYSIVFLLALDMLIGQFLKDRDKMKKITEKLKDDSAENVE